MKLYEANWQFVLVEKERNKKKKVGDAGSASEEARSNSVDDLHTLLFFSWTEYYLLLIYHLPIYTISIKRFYFPFFQQIIISGLLLS